MGKVKEVAAAIIIKDGKVLATRRGGGKKTYAGMWEFPGGKLESGETAEEAAVREIKEELDADIEVEELFETIEYDYPDFHLKMHCFICRLLSEHITLTEHSASRWLLPEELESVEWLAADVEVVARLAQWRGLTGG